MTTTKELIMITEQFAGKNSVKSACSTGFLMVEMVSNELANKVANVWMETSKMKVTVSNNRVYAF